MVVIPTILAFPPWDVPPSGTTFIIRLFYCASAVDKNFPRFITILLVFRFVFSKKNQTFITASVFTTTWENDPIWRAYFSTGLKPPTRKDRTGFSETKFMYLLWISLASPKTDMLYRPWKPERKVHDSHPAIFLRGELAVSFRECMYQKNTLLGTNISHWKSLLKMIFLFPRWDMLVPWRVSTKRSDTSLWKQIISSLLSTFQWSRFNLVKKKSEPKTRENSPQMVA